MGRYAVTLTTPLLSSFYTCQNRVQTLGGEFAPVIPKLKWPRARRCQTGTRMQWIDRFRGHLTGAGTVVKNLPANVGDARDAGSIPGLGRSPGAGLGNSLQYYCL